MQVFVSIDQFTIIKYFGVLLAKKGRREKKWGKEKQISYKYSMVKWQKPNLKF